MTNSKVMKVLGIGLVILMAVLVFASCAAPAAAPAEQEKMPVVKVTPQVAEPRGKIDYIGANFEPGQKVKVTFTALLSPEATPIENVVATDANKIEVDAVGSFLIAGARAPKPEGVWPIRVYNEAGEVIAATLVVVKKPAPKE